MKRGIYLYSFYFATLLLAARGWAAEFPDYPVPPRGGYKVSAEQFGLEIAANPLADAKEQKTYFGIALTGKGYLPVFISASNNSPDESFQLRKDALSFLLSGSPVSGKSTPELRARAGESVLVADVVVSLAVTIGAAMIGAGGGGNPLPLEALGLHLISKTADIQHNLLKKQLQSKTLSPGEQVHGFLFVPIPSKAGWREIHVRMPITPLHLEKILTFDLAIQAEAR
ncbi:MAG: hypothetical protein IT167_19395 [Bryobacterales bacterium]|nr:hypothetical protein [Bryobacterales bacterium]